MAHRHKYKKAIQRLKTQAEEKNMTLPELIKFLVETSFKKPIS